MNNCLFCKIINGESNSYKVFEDEICIGFLDVNPINSGHVLFVPKIHTSDILDMKNDEYLSLWRSVKTFSTLLKKAFKCRRVGIAIEGFTISHVHIHLVPVDSANELDPCRAKKSSNKELKDTQKKILQFIKL